MKKSLEAPTRSAIASKARRVAVGELLRRDALALGGQLDRLAVLVGAGEEEDVLAALAVVAGEHVGGDRRVRVAEMRLGVDVEDRRGDVEAHGRVSLLRRSARPALRDSRDRLGSAVEGRQRRDRGARRRSTALTGGRFLVGPLGASRTVLVDHVGRKSGKRRTTPLLYIADGDDVVIVASKGGSHKHPAWWLNLREMDETEIQVGSEHRRGERPARRRRRRRSALWPQAGRGLVGLRALPGGAPSARSRCAILSPAGLARAGLEQRVLALGPAGAAAAGDAGGLGERRLDVGEDRALGARGDQRLGDPVDVDVGAAAVAALGRRAAEPGRRRGRRGRSARSRARPAADRACVAMSPKLTPLPAAPALLVLRLRVELVELLAGVLGAVGGEPGTRLDPDVALAAGEHQAAVVALGASSTSSASLSSFARPRRTGRRRSRSRRRSPRG